MGNFYGVLDTNLCCVYSPTKMTATDTQIALPNFPIPLRKPDAQPPHPRLSFIRIPCNYTLLEVVTINLTKACPNKYIFDSLKEHKKWLKDNLKILKHDSDTKTFNWEYSTLVGVSADSLGKNSGVWRADYVMFTCQNQNAGKCTFKHSILVRILGGFREISLEETASGMF